MAAVTGQRLDLTACLGVRVEDPDIKNALSNQPPYNPLPEILERVPPLMSADAPASVSFGCRVSSSDTEKLLPQVQWVGDGSGCYPHSIHAQ